MNLSLYKPLRAACCFAIGLLLSATCLAQEPELSKLLDSAASGSTSERCAAIDDLGEIPARIVPRLTKLLTDSDPKVRWHSARALGDYGEQALPAAAALRKLLSDDSQAVRYHAAVTLGKLDDADDATVDALVVAATGQDATVARAAIASLRELQPGPERVVAALQQTLRSNDQALVTHAMEAIVENGGKSSPFLIQALKKPETVYLACAAIEHIGPDAAPTAPALTDLLSETKHSRLLVQALLALGSIGPAAQSASPQILPLLDFPTDKTVPVAAAYALGSIGATDADPALRTAMKRPDPFLQMVCAWSLAKIHPDDAQLKSLAVEKLQAGLKSDDPAIKSAAERGLAMLKPPAEAAAP